MKNKLLFFDTETTDIQSKDIVQLAIVREDGENLNLYFNPIQEISYSAMAIHHLTPEFLKDYPTFEESTFQNKNLKSYLDELAKEYIWVAHNVEFDVDVLRKKGIEIEKQICTFKLSRNMLSEGERDLESYSLQYLRYYLGLYKNENGENNTAHDALSDVYFLKSLFEYIQKNSHLSIENMIQISKEPAYIRNINFGKYAGKLLTEVVVEDRNYLEWMKENLTEKDDLLWNIDRVLSMSNGTLFG